jgi:hypothetical protein
MDPEATTACLVCGDCNVTSPNFLPAGMELRCSGWSVAEFLSRFNVIGSSHESCSSHFPEEARLCASCFTVVINCDQWHHSFENGIRDLKRKAASCFSRTTNGHVLVAPKNEVTEQPEASDRVCLFCLLKCICGSFKPSPVG